MAKHSESTHAKNITNFAALIEILRSFGTVYQPANLQLSIPQLQNQLHQAQMAQDLFNRRKSSYSDAVDKQQMAFAGVTTLTTSAGNALKASGTSAKALETYRTVARKVKGQRAAPLKSTQPQEQEATGGNTVSVAQMGYANRIDNFALLIETLKTEPLYQPNEPHLTIAGLESQLGHMRQTHLDAAETGLVATVRGIKAYVKSIFPASTPQYKHIAALGFKAQL